MNVQTHSYEVNIQWDSERKGTLSSSALPTKIEGATPPDFPNGMKGIWSPQHLFVAAVNACLMDTFLAIADNSKFEFISYKSNAIGLVGDMDGKLAVTEITIKPEIVIASSKHEEQLRKILAMSLDQCIISSSVKSTMNLEPIILFS